MHYFCIPEEWNGRHPSTYAFDLLYIREQVEKAEHKYKEWLERPRYNERHKVTKAELRLTGALAEAKHREAVALAELEPLRSTRDEYESRTGCDRFEAHPWR